MSADVRAVVAEAIACERAGLWSRATKSWAAARRSKSTVPREERRASEAGLMPGAELHHRAASGAMVLATYLGGGRVAYGGREYGSVSAAARAAMVDLGLVPDGHGWKFWGAERREVTR